MTDLAIRIEKALEITRSTTAKPFRFQHIVDGIETRALIDAKHYLFGRIDDLGNGEAIALWSKIAEQALEVAAASSILLELTNPYVDEDLKAIQDARIRLAKWLNTLEAALEKAGIA